MQHIYLLVNVHGMLWSFMYCILLVHLKTDVLTEIERLLLIDCDI